MLGSFDYIYEYNPRTGANGWDSGELLYNGQSFSPSSLASAPLLPGDANGDGRVDINDLTIVLANFGKTGSAWSQGCMDSDPAGKVDINDLTIVLANFGEKLRDVGSGLAAVPEPSALFCSASASLAFLPLPGGDDRAYPRIKERPSAGPFLSGSRRNAAVRGQPACWVGVRSSGRSA